MSYKQLGRKIFTTGAKPNRSAILGALYNPTHIYSFATYCGDAYVVTISFLQYARKGLPCFQFRLQSV